MGYCTFLVRVAKVGSSRSPHRVTQQILGAQQEVVGSIPLPTATPGQPGQPLWLKREAGPLVATLLLLGGLVLLRGVPGVGPALSPVPPGLKEQEVLRRLRV